MDNIYAAPKYPSAAKTEYLSRSITELDLSRKICLILANAQIRTIKDLLEQDPEDLYALAGISWSDIRKIKESMARAQQELASLKKNDY